MMTKYTEVDQLAADTIRMLAADGVQQANSGHPGLPLGAADLAYVLWTRFMKHNPADPRWFNRDRFVLSAGHGSMLLYALLHLHGYPLPLDELKRFRQWGSATPGHPEYDPARGIETTTGPLGQGLSNAVGMALAERMLAARFNKPGFPLIGHHTFVLASDGDLMEGISHEAASLAGHLGLSRLIVLYDDNGISIDGPTSLSFSDDVPQRFAAYHWHVQQVDGHDMAAIDAAIQAATAENERPSLIACRTHIGYKSPKQDNAGVHGAPLGEEDLARTKEAYGWPVEPKFYIPEEVKPAFARVQQKGKAEQIAWEKLVAKYQKEYPDPAAELALVARGELKPGWEKAIPVFPADKPLATRVASGKVLDAISSHLPTLVGGSADLTPSNNTRPQNASPVSKADFSGAYLHFGVREHGMGGILNGLALHGLRPYGGTFLVFSDYMRPSIRLAAIMKLPVVYVFTHDSIGLGEDGPTHQPVEHATALRSIPNLVVFRPADANETAAAWKLALQRKDGPTALLLTRQNVAIVNEKGEGVDKGAHILVEAEGGKPDVILVATGSEVEVALAGRQKLAAGGIKARVVSMPSWELFDMQPAAYRNKVLPPDVPAVAIEAGVSLAWNRYLNGGVGSGAVIGLNRFGASAPYKTLFEQFGFTADNVEKTVKRILGK
ncbi:MAG: transketolase [Anaerolineales bacterium]|nr:transketolase [Anaerolineales bacterium]